MSATKSLASLITTDPWARERLGHDSAVVGSPDTEFAVRVAYADFLAAHGEEEQERAARATLLLLWASAARGTTFLSAHPASPWATAFAAYLPLSRRASEEAETHKRAVRGAAQGALHAAQWAAVRGQPVPESEYEALVLAARAAEGAYGDYLASGMGTAPAARTARQEVDRWGEDLTGGPGVFGGLFRASGAPRAMSLDAAAW